MIYKEAVDFFRDALKNGKCSDDCPQCNAMELAITACEKQISQRPIGKYTDYKCPICGRCVRSGKGSSSKGRDNFCQRCGQKLDWGD